VDAAPAPFVPTPAPAITLVKQPDGSLVLRAVPPPGGRDLVLALKSDTPGTVESVQGVPAATPLPPGGPVRIAFDAAPQGVTVVLRPAGPGKLEVSYLAKLDRWPAGAPPLPKRPADVMAFGDSDTTDLTGTRRFSW